MSDLSWREAWDKSQGPKNRAETLLLLIKGFCMGTADVIPGVSGGTIAFITGIYDKLLAAIASLTKKSFINLVTFKWKQVLVDVHVKFIIFLAFGIITAIISTARLMHYLINNYAVFTWSLFFGLIVGSIFIVGREIENKLHPQNLFYVVVGGVFAYMIIGLIPVQTPKDLWFIYICGIIGISAMILPGISGSFLLLILGKYEYITGAIKNPFDAGNLIILICFNLGTITGLLTFAKLLNYFFNNYRTVTMGIMTGFMIGSMRKIWPWKETLESKVIRGKTHIIREANVLPEASPEVWGAVGLMVLGIVAVLLIDKVSQAQKIDN